MKIAVLSDIHGNMFALNAVLEDMKNYNPEKIFCLGDLAMAGPEPNSTVNFVKTQDWIVIQGNTDEMIANYSDEIFSAVQKNAPIMANALRYDITEMESDNIIYLKNLPAQKSVEIEGVKILLVHGSPRKNNENIFPNLPIVEIEEMVADTDADLIFCGHTHIPCGYQTENKITIVNDGSVGRPFTDDAKACYVLADINNGQIQIEHRMIDYDRESASKILSNQNFDGAEKLSQMLIKPELRHM